ncbi:hypothetical protein [Pedobacter sp. Leaf176]|uniref:hypothetical protein n=1 Tax=Pedobacter sp. Leaf176 TaxID=1736286 RepID=UPI0006F906D9|nr:hypothetical protein [Pedobacter sp. Leaf176]KQR72197.1 hypothetical protein ASF92_02540 [Pedobacter sp. Leaf176]
MADQKSLKSYWEEFFAASAKVSELNRNLSLGGIAIIWIFNKSNLIGSPNFNSLLPRDLFLPLIIIVVSLTCDLLQYLWRTVTLYIFYRIQIKKLKNHSITEAKADKLDAPFYIRYGGWTFFVLKILAMITAYSLIFKYLLKFLA